MDSMAPFSSMICLYLKKCDVPLRKLQTAHPNNGMIFPLKPYLRTIFQDILPAMKIPNEPDLMALKVASNLRLRRKLQRRLQKRDPNCGFSWGFMVSNMFFFSGGNRPLKGVLLTPSATASGFGSECVAKSPCGKQKQLKNDITQITNGKRRAMSLSDLHSSLR